MQFDLTKPQKLLQESARTLFRRRCSMGRVRELMESDSAHDPELWREFVDQGWTGLVFPEEVDGLDLGMVELAALMEVMGEFCVPGPFLNHLSASVVLNELRNHDLAGARLREAIDGESRIVVALHETESRWGLNGVRLALRREAGRITLEGSKSRVSGAVEADWILAAVRDDEELAVVLIPANQEGVTVKATPAIDPTRPMGEIHFDGVLITEDHVLGRGEAALGAFTRWLQVGTVMTCADLVGGMQWVLDATVEYAKSREQFGRPIGSHQMIQEQCADMLLWVESSRSAAYYAAWALDEGDPDTGRALSMAKAYCSDAGREVGNRGVQVHGGIGFTWEHDLHLYYKRAKASELLYGDATFHRELLAKLILDE